MTVGNGIASKGNVSKGTVGKGTDDRGTDDKRKCADAVFPETKEKQGTEIVRILKSMYPEADCTLRCRMPWQLLISAILAAQCTDARVNMITEGLFKEFPDIKSFADADMIALEDRIHSCGFFHAKAKAIKGSMQRILHEYGGEVPSSIDKLLTLPGVGRKIANLVLGDCFGKQAVVVDTHCLRISGLLGLTESKDPYKVEKDLMKYIPQSEWSSYGHCIVAHGRAICIARRPKCSICALQCVCRYGFNLLNASPKEK